MTMASFCRKPLGCSLEASAQAEDSLDPRLFRGHSLFSSKKKAAQVSYTVETLLLNIGALL
jgi:hypothetical protein